jgi:Anti-sigma factor NepR
MTELGDDRKNVGFEPTRRANMSADGAHLLDRAERWLRPADQLDYAIRRWVIPVPSFLETPSRGVIEPTPHSEASVRSDVRLSEFQAAIGRYLRAQYDDLAQPIPARLVELLGQLEQRNSRSEGAARGAG